jgi:fructose-1,6-bisphosphatase/inositol monophosphatase family enzyme
MVKDIVINAGNELKRQYYSIQASRAKEKFDLVTESDLLIENMIVQELKQRYPDDSIYGEEMGVIEGNGHNRWIIDPIDGTADFVFGVPYFAISVALERNGEICEGYVYNPISEEFYYSTKDQKKSFLNDEEIQVSTTGNIPDALVAFGFSTNYEKITQYYRQWECLFENSKKGLPLITPALTLCNVARGRIDIFIDSGCSMEGQAAAGLIVKNAGGHVYNYDCSDWDHRSKGIIASNGIMDGRSLQGCNYFGIFSKRIIDERNGLI